VELGYVDFQDYPDHGHFVHFALIVIGNVGVWWAPLQLDTMVNSIIIWEIVISLTWGNRSLINL
jgi:hypothetical protein